MENIFKVTKYQLMFFKIQTAICFSVIAFNILISVVVGYLIDAQNAGSRSSAGSTDIIALTWIFILGLCCFKPSFKFLLANGVSRKRFFWGNIYCLAIVAGLWAVILTLLCVLARMFTRITVLYELLYENLNPIHAVVWTFAALFLLAVLGWCINMLYYRSTKRLKYAVTLAPFVLYGLLTVINQATGGILLRSISQFLIAAMGFSAGARSSYIGALTMLLFAAVICSLNFLLLRKAQLKD